MQSPTTCFLVLSLALATTVTSPVQTSTAGSCRQQSLPTKKIETGVTIIGTPAPYAAIKRRNVLAASPDGEQIVSGDIGLQRFNQKRKRFEGKNFKFRFNHVVYSRDGSKVFGLHSENEVRNEDGEVESTSRKTTVHIFDAETLKSIDRFEFESRDTGIVDAKRVLESPNGRWLAIDCGNRLAVVDADGGEIIRKFNVTQGWSADHNGCLFLDGETCIAVCENYKVAVFDIATGERQSKDDFSIIGQTASRLSVSRDQSTVAILNNSITFYRNEKNAFSKLGSWDRQSNILPETIALSSDGKLAACGHFARETNQYVVDLIDTHSGEAKTLEGMSMTNLQFIEGTDELMVFGSVYGLTKVSGDGEILERASLRESVSNAVFSSDTPDLAMLFLGRYAGFYLFDLSMQRPVTESRFSFPNRGARFEDRFFWCRWADQKFVLERGTLKGEKLKINKSTLGSSGAIQPTTIKYFRAYLDQSAPETGYRRFQAVDIRPSEDGSHFFVLNETQSFSDFDVDDFDRLDLRLEKRDTDGKKVDELQIDHGQLDIDRYVPRDKPSRISPTGTALLYNGALYSVDGNDVQLIRDFEDDLSAAEFSNDGKWLAIADKQGVEIVDPGTGETTQSYNDADNALLSFSNDSRRFAFGSTEANSKIEIVSCETWKPVLSRTGTQAMRTSINLDADGSRLLIGLKDHRLEIWDLDALK